MHKSLITRITTTLLVSALSISCFVACSKKSVDKVDFNAIDEAIEEFEDAKKPKVRDFNDIYDMIIEEADGASEDELEDLEDCLLDLMDVVYDHYCSEKLSKKDYDKIVDTAASKETKHAFDKALVEEIEEYSWKLPVKTVEDVVVNSEECYDEEYWEDDYESTWVDTVTAVETDISEA